MTIEQDATPSIAIVGASVRGTSVLERVLAGAPDLAAGRLVVHVIDPYPPGSGRIWRDGQPPQLIMNTVAAQSTVFTDASVRMDGPIRTGPSLAEWCRRIEDDPDLADLPADVRAEASRTAGHSNPSRLLYGHYLRWCFDDVIRSAPPGVDVRVHRASAVALDGDTGGGWRIALDTGGTVRADAVVLAMGWLERDDVPRHPRVVSPGNPIDQDLSGISPGSTVAVRGLGMGFFDTVSQLTEQRGGRFTALAGGRLRYDASGREPVLVAGSRRGVPYRAKPDFGAPPFFPEQRILRAALPALRGRRPVDFARDVLPLIERDAAVDYYRALARVEPGSVRDLDGMLAALVAGREPVDAIVGRHVVDPAPRLSLRDAADPLRGVAAASDDDIIDIVRRDIAEAARGMDSPLKLALHSYAAARGAVIDLVAFGGLTSSSYPAYRDYLAVAASFGSGPPLARARQLVAVHDAGLVRFAGRGMTVGARGDRILVESADAGRVPADRAIEAWLPGPTLERTADPLLRRLVDDGRARAWRFDDGTPSDALDIRPEDGAVIAADGAPAADLFSVGVPHEDIRVFTIIAPVPGTNSSVLRETDAAARAALRAVASRRLRPAAAATVEVP